MGGAAARRRVQSCRDGEDCDTALAQCFAWAAQEFPEEIALWCLSGAVGPDVWQNPNFQRSVRDALLALRELRSQVVDLAMQRDALLSRVAPAAEPARFAPFVGTGHRLDNLSSLDLAHRNIEGSKRCGCCAVVCVQKECAKSTDGRVCVACVRLCGCVQKARLKG